MQLKLVQELLEQYKRYLRTNAATDNLYLWESQRIFQETWNLEAADLSLMYDQCLQNSKTRRHWNRENFEPKRKMLIFARMAPDYVIHAFKDLFNEAKEIEGRMDRFVFYCDELLEEYRQHKPKSIETNHDHGRDHEMTSLYLSFKYPDRYCPYFFEPFCKIMERVKAPDLPKTNNLERFFKVMRTFYQLLKKDSELVNLHQQRITGEHYQKETLLLCYDFYMFSVKH